MLFKSTKNQYLKSYLQFFANPDGSGDGSGGGEGTNPTNQLKTYTQEEYDSVKTKVDKYSSEIAELKKQLKAKQTDDEKKAEEEKEQAQRFANLQDKLATYELKGELQKSGTFTSEEVDKIVELKNDTTKMLNKISEIVKAKIEEAKKNAIVEFTKGTVVGGSGGSGKTDELDEDVQAFIKSEKSNATLKAREHYLGKK